MPVSTYNLNYNNDCEFKVSIDEDFPHIDDEIKEMVEFWSNSEESLRENDGDYTITFLKNLCRRLVYLSIDYSLSGIIDRFNTEEGYCPLDGSQGIRLLSADEWEVDDDCIWIEKY